jgi:hypothetical protein
MSARRCHACDIAYPADGRHDACEACGQSTVYEASTMAHGQWPELVQAVVDRQHVRDGESARVYHFRLERFIALGCPELEAHLLAGAMYGEDRIDWRDYAALLARGCPVEQAALILL